jgi:hypothetical protein
VPNMPWSPPSIALSKEIEKQDSPPSPTAPPNYSIAASAATMFPSFSMASTPSNSPSPLASPAGKVPAFAANYPTTNSSCY